MRKIKTEEGRQCPKCGKKEKQVKMGCNRSGTQRCKCKECGTGYTNDPKKREYPEETRKLAIKLYGSGISGRGVGNVLGMNKSNVMNWIKKANEEKGRAVSVESSSVVELEELYWFLKQKPRTEARENAYIMTIVSRSPRQIVRHAVP